MDIQNVINNLKNRGFEAEYCEDRETLINRIKSEIEVDQTIGIGGSISIEELDLYNVLKKEGNEIAWHWRPETDDRMEIYRKAIFSDVYLTSSNAITEDGLIINIDKNGNRVAAMIFGPRKVIMIVGVNKISRNKEEAIERIKSIACAQNARRLNLNLSCALTGKCSGCNSKDRICVITTLIERKPPTLEFKVFIVNEHLGY